MRVAHRLWQFRQLADGERALVQTEEERVADLMRQARTRKSLRTAGALDDHMRKILGLPDDSPLTFNIVNEWKPGEHAQTGRKLLRLTLPDSTVLEEPIDEESDLSAEGKALLARTRKRAQSIDGFDMFDVEDAPDRRAIVALRAQYGQEQSIPASESIKPEGLVDVAGDRVFYWPHQAFAVEVPHTRSEAEAAAAARRIQRNLIPRGKLQSHQILLKGLPLYVLYQGGGFVDGNGELYEDNFFMLPADRTAAFELSELERQYQILASVYREATERAAAMTGLAAEEVDAQIQSGEFRLPEPGDVDAEDAMRSAQMTYEALERLEDELQAGIEERADEGPKLAQALWSTSRAASTFRAMFAAPRRVRIATPEGVDEVDVIEEHGDHLDVELDGDCIRIPIEIVLCDVQEKEAASWQDDFAAGARMRVTRSFQPEYDGPALQAGTEVVIDGAHPADHDMELGLVDPDPTAFANYRIRVNGPQGQSIISLRQFTDGLDLIEGPRAPVEPPADDEDMFAHYVHRPRAPRPPRAPRAPERTTVDDTYVRDRTRVDDTMVRGARRAESSTRTARS